MGFVLPLQKAPMIKPENILPEHQKFLVKIGKSLKVLRKEKKLTIEALATEVSISRNTINLMELGQVNFQLTTLLTVLKFHNIPLSEFVQSLS